MSNPSVLSTRVKTILRTAMEEVFRQFGGGAISDLGNVDLGGQLDSMRDGVVPSIRLNMATNPSNTNTVTIGGHVFKFLTALTTQDTFTQIKIGASAAATLAVLINAINGVADSVNILEGTTTFASVASTGGWAVAADSPAADTLRIRQVRLGYHGNVAYVEAMAPASITVSEGLTDAADIWEGANINEAGHAPGKRWAAGSLTITTAQITAGHKTIDLPFTPDIKTLNWTARSSAGVLLACDEAVVANASNKTITLTLAGTGAPDWVNGDVFSYFISE